MRGAISATITSVPAPIAPVKTGWLDSQMRRRDFVSLWLCFALVLWNGQDPILKERLFGLASAEGNHGKDVKEYYFYLDATPTHSYLKWLYKYPQRAYPYDEIISGNRRSEYELIDTGVFGEDRYFNVYVEYDKFDPEDVLDIACSARMARL